MVDCVVLFAPTVFGRTLLTSATLLNHALVEALTVLDDTLLAFFYYFSVVLPFHASPRSCMILFVYGRDCDAFHFILIILLFLF